MSNEGQTQAQTPTFRVVKKAQIPVKILSRIMKETRNAQGLIPQIYSLMQYAQDKCVEAEVKLGDEAARRGALRSGGERLGPA